MAASGPFYFHVLELNSIRRISPVRSWSFVMVKAELASRDFVFEGAHVRCVGSPNDLWFVAGDVCEALGIVWKGNETLADISPEWRGVRKLRIPQMNQYGSKGFVENELIVIREPAVYQLAVRSRKPEAKAFQKWLFDEVLPSIRRTGMYVSKRKGKYIRAGKDEQWIETRVEGIDARKGFTDVLDEHGVKQHGYALCTDAVYKPILGSGAKGAKLRRSLPQKANLRDNLTVLELAQVKLAELLAAETIEREEIQGNESCADKCGTASQHIATAVQLTREAMSSLK
jgi:prophage antirepressor-like protein